MKSGLAAATLAIGLIGFTAPANATLRFNLGGCDFSADPGGTGSCGGNGADLLDNYLTLTFTNNGANTVRLTISTTSDPVLSTTTGKITDVWFNVGGGLTFANLSFAPVSGVPAIGTIPGGNVASAGIFDIDFQYNPSGSWGAFHPSLTSIYDITGPGLTESNFNDLSSKGVPAALHLNITGNGNSGHYATTTIPAPASILLVGTGLLGLMGIRRNGRKN